MSHQITRREFLERTGRVVVGGTAVGGIAALGAQTKPATQPALEWRNRQPTMTYARLGRTNFMASRCVFGAAGLYRSGGGDTRLMEIAVDRGVNYLDTSQGYGASEEVIGGFLRRNRDRVWVVSKARDIGWPTMTIRRGEDDKAARLWSDQLEASLSKLKTEPIDCYMVQGVEHEWVVTMDSLYAAFEKARKAGKVRYFGLATHTNVARVCELAAQTGRYDVVMLAVHPGTVAELSSAIRKLREAGVGVVSMKTGGKVRGEAVERAYGDMFRGRTLSPHQKAYAYLLHRGGIDAFNSHMPSREILEENLAVPTLALSRADLDAIEQEVVAAAAGACRHCGRCNAVCPNGVPAADLLRCHAYAVHYGERVWARDLLTEIGPARAGSCTACGACRAVCPSRIDLPGVIASVNAGIA